MENKTLSKYRVVFSIDRCGDLKAVAHFLHYLDKLRALDKFTSNVVLGSGVWEGQAELTINMDYYDFMNFVKGHKSMENQVCWLRVPYESKQPLYFEYPDGRLEEVKENNSVHYFVR